MIIDIAGAALAVFFTADGLRLSIKLLRRQPHNIFWLYFVWLTSFLSMFVFSWALEHILSYPLLRGGQEVKNLWSAIAPYSASLETLALVLAGGLSLFFIAVNNLYQEVSMDKKRLSDLNAELASMNAELEGVASERSLNLMALRVADRVRNPASVIGAIVLRLFNTPDLSEPVRKKLMDVREASGRLDLIVREYEDILKNKQKLFKVEDLNAIVRETLLAFNGKSKDSAVSITPELFPGPLYFYAVRHLVRIAIVHLLRNAADVSPRGSDVAVRTGLAERRVFISISDRGPGIDPEDRQKIFDLFYSTKGRLGTGLPIVKQIVDEHGGEIKVESSQQGSVFTAYFPAGWLEFASSPSKKGRGPGEPSPEGLE
ncbi:MAG: HAMP domain-containing sensor histidine kinase [Nitrospiraceae bacterium]|nr:HAMP domain-containing sensor histidine kinase [Nitrospiraceae bacterium]